MDKNAEFYKYYMELIGIARKHIDNRNFEISLQAIASAANVAYKYNQFYTDLNLENLLIQISENVVKFSFSNTQNNVRGRKKVLFYDGFGLDRRGISIVMNKAICENGYKLIYVSPLSSKGKQPTLSNVLERYDVTWKYYENRNSYLKSISQLQDIFENEAPDFAYMYTTPYDVSGVVVFNSLRNRCFRCQIDLTDHAFWLGINAFDICNGGRQLSACIQHLYRGIPLDKMTRLDANLFVDDVQYQGLPFDDTSRFLFSGGSLYKTLGDEEHVYYRIIDYILLRHADIKYLYAGYGDDSQVKKLENKYPGRVFLIGERPDFFQIMKRCTIYINTYPMFGGLMMRYAALAGKIPITLKHNSDSDGILINQEKRQIEYDSFENLVTDIDKLLSDANYLKEREKLLEGAVVSEDCYIRNIKIMIEQHKTEFTYGVIEDVDVNKLKREFLERFSYEDIANAIVTKRNKSLWKCFPKLFFYRILISLIKRVRSKNDTV